MGLKGPTQVSYGSSNKETHFKSIKWLNNQCRSF